MGGWREGDKTEGQREHKRGRKWDKVEREGG